MGIRITEKKGGGYMVDLRVHLPSGQWHRERVRSPVTGKSASQRWAQDRLTHILQHGLEAEKKEVPTLAVFETRYVDGYVTANRLKKGSSDAITSIFKTHLVPQLGAKKLDKI